ncbi:SagB/ThcOx family dehydrogenase [Candidatus Thorarchaeota archaeon]|nr:MAG: SagB/ThcOx family dehydrogenase [Candidatus Thorarchaeota archaeon]
MSKEQKIQQGRKFLRADSRKEFRTKENYKPDEKQNIPAPPMEKPCLESQEKFELVPLEDIKIKSVLLTKAIKNRSTHRKYSDAALTLQELSFLLWSTQGVKEVQDRGGWSKRVVPSGGARHPFETYLIVDRVEGLDKGIYRYLPLQHRLCRVTQRLPESDRLIEATNGQRQLSRAAVTFVWAAIPYRTEWRYSIVAHKDIALEAGHICQNLYLSCEAIDAGTCAIANYNQEVIDSIIGVDGEKEFTVYLAPVGKIPSE